MKDKIFTFIIGVLVGAVLSTGAFYIYTATSGSNCSTPDAEMNGREPPEMPNGENGQPPEKPDGEPPEKPNGENGQPPEKPNE